jgi:transposase-like protein
MAPRKLSDADKRDVVELYRQLNETTSTIAERYGVSNSTISRILKNLLPEAEYSRLIAQKRQGVSADKDSQDTPLPVETPSGVAKPVLRSQKQALIQASEAESRAAEDSEPVISEGDRRSASLRRRTRTRTSQSMEDSARQLPLLEETSEGEAPPAKPDLNLDFDDIAVAESPLLEDADYDDLDDDEDIEGDIEDDYDEDEDEDYDEGEDDFVAPHLADAMQIVPLSEAALPQTCYLIIDRLSELITRPLSDFADLGQIPSSESGARTLPVFDNHRVARRFSRRNQRVIKVPNGQLLTKTSTYLQAKGIEHLLIDGNVYSLMADMGSDN